MPEPSEPETTAVESPAARTDPVQELWLLWRQGQRADVQQFLERAGQLTPPQVAAVLLVDQRERWLTGERLLAESYLPLYPTLRGDLEYAVELIYGEFLLREELGEGPTAAEYLERFPQYAPRLRQQLEFHQAVERDPSLGAGQTVLAPAEVGSALGTDAAAPAPAASCWPVVRGYEILGKLGRGGMGMVYQAWQRDANRVVALKMVLAGADAGPDALARFRIEIEAVARLHHPYIVPIYEVGEQDGRPYFSMEFAEDGTLAQKLVGIPLPFRRAAQVVEMLARAIHYAHERGVLHRDLTPANVLLMADGTPKITDFGLAKILIGGANQTQSGAILGTPSYMPPEQAAGKTKEIGPAGDVYGLGAILYELLTGRPPFRAETPLETLRQVLSEEPVPPSRLQSHLPRDLVTICLKCLQKEPHQRYGSARELAEDLQRFLSDKPVGARRTGLPEQAWRWCRRKPAVATLAAAVALLVLAVAVVSSIAALWLRDERNDATDKLWASYRDQARAGRFSRRVGQRFNSLDVLAKAVQIARQRHMPEERFLELRNEAVACLALPDLRLAKQWDGWPSGSFHLHFDGKLEHYARADRQGALSIRRVADDAEIGRLPGSGFETWPLFSRDGQFLAVHSNSACKVWKLVGQEPALVVEEPAGVAGYVDFSPDGRQVAILHMDGSVSLYDLASGHRLSRLGAAPSPRHVAFHPNNRQLAVACGASVQIRDGDTGKVLADLPQAAGAHSVVWHPEGQTLAVVCDDRRVYLWDVGARKPTRVLEGHKNQGIVVAFNHAGDLLASRGWDGMLRLWDPRTSQQLFSTQSGMDTPRFSSDDRLLAADVTEAKLGLWEVADGHEYRTLVGDALHGKGEHYKGAISSDGRLLALGMADGVRFWDLASGKELAFLPLRFTGSVLFEPSGALLTNGEAGLLRWPVQMDPASIGLVRVGPPQKLALPGSICEIALSQDGRVIASAQFQGGLVLHADHPNQPVRLSPHGDVRYIDVSPDGQWVATGSHNGTKVKIWEARTGQLMQTLPVEAGSRVAFSPDGQWLATSGEGARLWAVGSWQEGAPTGGGTVFAFSPDGKLLAVETNFGTVRLIDPKTGREYVRLEDPNQDRAHWLRFSPDGTQLVTTNNDSQSIHVWDLRAIRRQLAEIGLDWNLPAYPVPARANDTKPFQVAVDLGDLTRFFEVRTYEAQARNHERRQEYAQAVEAWQKVIALDPRHAPGHNNLAWLYVTGPAELRAADKALPLAQEAMELDPQSTAYRNTLGVVYHRLGRYQDAIARFEKNLQEDHPYAALDWFFLAMSYQQLGQTAKAKECYARARQVRTMEKNLSSQYVEELKNFQAEAEVLLKITRP